VSITHNTTTLKGGGFGDVSIAVDSTHKIGAVTFTCVLDLDGVKVKQLTLRVRADVHVNSIAFDSSRIYFERVTFGKGAERQLCPLVDRTKRDWTLKSATTTAEKLAVSVDTAADSIRCRVLPTADYGNIDEVITVITQSNKGERQLQIPVVGRVVAGYQPNPARLFFGATSADSIVRGKVTLDPPPSGRWVPQTDDASDRAGVLVTDDSAIVIELVTPSTPGFFEGCISFHSSQEPRVTAAVPYAGLVRN
jgi:hypothetical protein